MRKQRASWAIALILMTALNVSARSLGPQGSKPRTAPNEQDILQACRDAVAELKFRRESEDTLKKQVEELKALSTAKDDRISHLEAAIAKYEAAVQARTQAETFVAELRINYEKQVALVEKQLAVEQSRTNHWKTLAKLGVFAGLMLGGVLGYAVANK